MPLTAVPFFRSPPRVPLVARKATFLPALIWICSPQRNLGRNTDPIGVPDRPADHHDQGAKCTAAVDDGIELEEPNDIEMADHHKSRSYGHRQRYTHTDARHFLEEAGMHQYTVSDHLRQIGDHQHD